MIEGFFKTIQKIATEQELEEGGYRIISNHGYNASQTVHHFHVHLLGGKQLGGLLSSDKSIR
jgi:diadenosine tetraphosphate (Ap4A) HIT family hydrolase